VKSSLCEFSLSSREIEAGELSAGRTVGVSTGRLREFRVALWRMAEESDEMPDFDREFEALFRGFDVLVLISPKADRWASLRNFSVGG